MESGFGRQEPPSAGSHRSSPIPRGPSTPTSSPPVLSTVPKGSGHSVLADRYTIGETLGRGAHGRVFKAFDKEDNKFVAVKQIPLTGISKDSLNGVIGEIDLLKNLDHTNIVQYFDSVKTNNHLYIILEYMESGSLANLIKPTNCGVFEERLVAVIVAQILQGLKYLHAQGVVHRDLKGANILTTKDMIIKLADFGVAAKLFDNRGPDGNKAEYHNTIAGSPYWMAPEVIDLQSVTTAADIWSIGSLIIELLTGSPPYFECQPYQALYRIVQDDHPPFPDGTSDLLESFLRLCFRKEPAERPTAEDLLEHEWVASHGFHRGGSPSDKRGTGESTSQENTTDNENNVTAVLERIFKHNNMPKTRKTNQLHHQPPLPMPGPHQPTPNRPTFHNEKSPDSEAAPFSEAKELMDINNPGSSSTVIAENTSPAEISEPQGGKNHHQHPHHHRENFSNDNISATTTVATLAPSPSVASTTAAAITVPLNNGGGKKKLELSTSVPQLMPLIPDNSREHQSRTGSVSNSEISGNGRLRKERREDVTPPPDLPSSSSMMANERNSTLLQNLSGNSSPEGKYHSAQQALIPREEPELSVIYSDRISEFGSNPNRAATNETWEPGYESVSLHSNSCSGQSQIHPPRGREHYNPSDIKRVLSSLHPHLPLTTIVPALQDLVNLIKHDAEAKTYFINEDGLLLLLEFLLLFTDLIVVEQSLVLSNMICANNVLMLRDASAIGLAAEIFHFTQREYPASIRLEASRFLYSMCFTSVKSMDHLIKCQGLKWLVTLLEDGERMKLELKKQAVQCLLHIIEVQGIGMEGRILRMLCMADLPKKLISALLSIHHQTVIEIGESTFREQPDIMSAINTAKSNSANSVSEDCIGESPSEISINVSQNSPSSDEGNQNEEYMYHLKNQNQNQPQPHPHHPQPHDYHHHHWPHEMEVSSPGYRYQQKSSKGKFYREINQSSSTQNLSERMIDLLYKICISQAEVHRHMCMPGILEDFQKLLDSPSMELVYKVVVCLKCLSMRPTVMENLQEVNTVCKLIELLSFKDQSEMTRKIQKECLIVIDNICKCVVSWRERAVQHGIVPHLCRLCAAVAESDSNSQHLDQHEMEIRKFAVPLLCRLLTVPSETTRQSFTENNVLVLFLDLLKEEKWHKVVLEALANWLEADIRHVESVLINNSNVQHFISILRSYRYRLPDEISAVINPLKRMLDKSDKLSRKAGLGGLAPVVLDMLAEVDAQTCLTLLRTLTRLYGMHPKPKEFIRKYGVEDYLERLSNAMTEQGSDERVLIQKEIAELTNAFQMNQIW